MKIAFYTDTYHPTMDGVVRSIDLSREELINRGHRVYVFSPGNKEFVKLSGENDVYYYDSIPFKPYPKYRLAIKFPPSKFIQKAGIDIIHSHGMGSMGFAGRRTAKKLKIPLVGTFHTLIQYATHYLFKNKHLQDISQDIAWKYLRWYYNSCDITIVPTKTIASLVKKNGFKNVHVIPNGVDLKRFQNDNIKCSREMWDLEKDDPTFLFLGRLVKEKNLDVLIKGAKYMRKELPNMKILIAGEGPAKEYYIDLARRHKVEKYVKFLGFVPEEKIAELYKCSDVFVFPSKFETQGLSGIEAMANGKPIVGANYLAIKELVKDDKNGYLFDPDDPKDCAEKAIKAYHNKEKLSKGSLRLVQKYSIENTTNQLLEIYEKLLKN